MTNQHASIFSNCSVHYDLEVNFEICIEATDPCYSIEQIETAVTISYVDYCSSVTLFPLAGFMNIYCLLVILPIYHRLQNNSKKKYIFLITRCIAGLLAVTAWLLLQCVYLRSMTPNTGDSAGYVLALSLYIGSTYVLLGSYVGMAGVLYLGVMNPVGFNQHLTLRLTYIAVCVIFIFALILSIPLAILQAAIAIPISIKCRDKTCAPVVTLINFILVSGSLIITTITLSFVLISLLNHRNAFKRLDTMSNASLNSGIRLLIWTLFVVILITIAEIIPFTFMEIRRSEGTITGCYWFYHAGKVIVEAIFALIESSIWSVALIVDPLTNLILDRTVSRQAASQVKWIQRSCERLVIFVIGKFSRRKKIREEDEEEEKVCQEQTIQTEIISSSPEINR